jgi:hypothetical protein
VAEGPLKGGMMINWNLIARLPADGIVYPGSPEYGAFRVTHRPADKMHVEQILAETGEGLHRRRMVPRKGKPHNWAQVELIGGRL